MNIGAMSSGKVDVTPARMKTRKVNSLSFTFSRVISGNRRAKRYCAWSSSISTFFIGPLASFSEAIFAIVAAKFSSLSGSIGSWQNAWMYRAIPVSSSPSLPQFVSNR